MTRSALLTFSPAHASAMRPLLHFRTYHAAIYLQAVSHLVRDGSAALRHGRRQRESHLHRSVGSASSSAAPSGLVRRGSSFRRYPALPCSQPCPLCSRLTLCIIGRHGGHLPTAGQPPRTIKQSVTARPAPRVRCAGWTSSHSDSNSRMPASCCL